MYNKFMRLNSKTGFSLVELLVVLGIIAILASIIFISLGPARKKARDARRKTDLAQIGQMLYASACYLPNAGAGDYDIADLVPELKIKYPQMAQYSFLIPKDPLSGSEDKTNYRYQVTSDGHCAIYANFENEQEPVTLSSLTAPGPNSGTGILKSSTEGPNSTFIYYQISK